MEEEKEKTPVAAISATNKINHMSKEFIRKQPFIQFTGAIHIIYTNEESRKAIKHLYEKNMSEFVVGVDTETKPTFKKGEKRHHPSWIQVADDSIGKKRALKKYDWFALNTSIFWKSTRSNITPAVEQFHEIFVTN